MLTYSGLLPAYLAGHVSLEQCQIAVADYAKAAGATVVLDTFISLDAERQCCQLASGKTVHYDLLSLDTGSVTTKLSGIASAETDVLSVRPLNGLLTAKCPKKVVVVGAGAGGVELAFAYAHRGAEVSLVAGTTLLPGHHRRVARTTAHWLKKCRIKVRSGRAQLCLIGVSLDSGRELAADLVIVATGASAPEWIAGSGLRRSKSGFIAVNDTLQSQSHPNVYVTGTTC